MHERREYRRVRIKRKVGIVQSSGDVVHAWTFDLSLGGMQIRTEYSADVGAQFDAFMGLLDPFTGRHAIVAMRVQVIHILFDGTAGCYRIGMRFLEFKRGADVFERFLDSRLNSPLNSGE